MEGDTSHPGETLGLRPRMLGAGDGKTASNANERRECDMPEETKGKESEKPKAPPKPKLCPLMGPGTHPCRPECSWSWVNPEDKRCICSVSMISAILRDVVGLVRQMMSLAVPPQGPPGPGKGPGGIINLEDLKKKGE